MFMTSVREAGWVVGNGGQGDGGLIEQHDLVQYELHTPWGDLNKISIRENRNTKISSKFL